MGCGRECGKAQRSYGAARLSEHMVAQSGFTAFFSTLTSIQAVGSLTSRWRLALSCWRKQLKRRQRRFRSSARAAITASATGEPSA